MRFRHLTALTAIGVVSFGTAGANGRDVDTVSLESSKTPSMELSDDFEGASGEHSDSARHWKHGSIGPIAGGPEDETRSTVRTTPVSAPEIDSQSAASALTMLLGALAVLHGRRITRRRQNPTPRRQ